MAISETFGHRVSLVNYNGHVWYGVYSNGTKGTYGYYRDKNEAIAVCERLNFEARRFY